MKSKALLTLYLAVVTSLSGLATASNSTDGLVAAPDSTVGVNGTCDGICARRLLFHTSYSSAADGMSMAFKACNGSNWCATEAKEFCPDAVNGAVTWVANEILENLNIDYNNMSNITLLSTMSTISANSTRSGINEAMRILKNPTLKCDDAQKKDLRLMYWQLGQPQDPIKFDRPAFDKEIANADPTEIAKGDDTDDDDDNDNDVLPWLGGAAAAVLGPLIAGGVCVNDPILCKGATSDFLRRFLKAAKGVLPPRNSLRNVVEEAAGLSTESLPLAPEVPREPLPPIPEEVEPPETPVQEVPPPEPPVSPPEENTRPNTPETPKGRSPESPVLPPEENTRPNTPENPEGALPESPVLPPEENTRPNTPDNPRVGSPESPVSPPEPAPLPPEVHDTLQVPESPQMPEPNAAPIPEPVPEPIPQPAPLPPPVPEPNLEPAPLPPPVPETPSIPEPNPAPAAPVPQPLKPRPRPLPGRPSAPLPGQGPPSQLFRYSEMKNGQLIESTLRPFNSLDKQKDISLQNSRESTASNMQKYQPVGADGKDLGRARWLDSKRMTPIDSMPGEWEQQGGQQVRMAERAEPAPAGAPAPASTPVLNALGEPIVASSAGTLLSVAPLAAGAAVAPEIAEAAAVAGAGSMIFETIAPGGAVLSSLVSNPLSGALDVFGGDDSGSSSGGTDDVSQQSDSDHKESNTGNDQQDSTDAQSDHDDSDNPITETTIDQTIEPTADPTPATNSPHAMESPTPTMHTDIKDNNNLDPATATVKSKGTKASPLDKAEHTTATDAKAAPPTVDSMKATHRSTQNKIDLTEQTTIAATPASTKQTEDDSCNSACLESMLEYHRSKDKAQKTSPAATNTSPKSNGVEHTTKTDAKTPSLTSDLTTSPNASSPSHKSEHTLNTPFGYPSPPPASTSTTTNQTTAKATPTKQTTMVTSVKWVTSVTRVTETDASATINDTSSSTAYYAVPPGPTPTYTGCDDLNDCKCDYEELCQIGPIDPQCYLEILNMRNWVAWGPSPNVHVKYGRLGELVSDETRRARCDQQLQNATRRERKQWAHHIMLPGCISPDEFKPVDYLNEMGDCQGQVVGFNQIEAGAWISGMLPLECPYDENARNLTDVAKGAEGKCKEASEALIKQFKITITNPWKKEAKDKDSED